MIYCDKVLKVTDVNYGFSNDHLEAPKLGHRTDFYHAAVVTQLVAGTVATAGLNSALITLTNPSVFQLFKKDKNNRKRNRIV